MESIVISTLVPGCFTGRLQPIHLGHIELLQHVLDRHEHLIVGITNPDPTSRLEHADHPTRHLEASNPFTFYERSMMVHAALAAASVPRQRYAIVPFPLHDPARVEHYVPLDAVQYVRVFSRWEEQKVSTLAEYGYDVQVVAGDVASRISATEIRTALRDGQPWTHLVAGTVADLIARYTALRPLG